MNDKQWVMFFDLLKLIVHLPDFSASEKAGAVVGKAKDLDADPVLSEFLSWDFPFYD